MCDPCMLVQLIPVLEKAVECFSDCVASKTKTIQDLNPNISALKRKIENLTDRRKEVEDEKEQAEKEGKKILVKVIKWLREVEDFVDLKLVEEMVNNNWKPLAMWLKEDKPEDMVNNNKKTIVAWVNEVEEMVNKKEKCCTSFLNCCDSELHKVSGQVERKTQRIEELLKDANFPNGVIDTKRLTPVVDILGPTIHQDQKTARDTLNEVMKLLKDDGIRSIGIWGLAGIGKTTLVRTLNNELEKPSTQSNPFTVVIWAEVSNRLDKNDDEVSNRLDKDDDQFLQTLIARRLKMEVQKGEDMGSQLCQRLQNEKFLLILDNVWKKIDLNKLGIPRHEGCKIILTTRFMQVCRDMRTDKDVKMNLLNLEEAEQLFRQKARYEAQAGSRNIKKLVEECCGLPLAIDFLGNYLNKCNVDRRWHHVLKKLQTPESPLQEIADEVYTPLKRSYEALKVDTQKSCFMYCSLFPQGFSIETTELVKYWMAEGLIEEQQNYLDSVDEGIHIIESLKESSLLEDGDKKGTVKMHDVVRDVAIWIASSSKNGRQSLVRSGIGLSEISDRELSNSNSLKRVSFMNNEITKLPKSVECHNVSTLLLQHNGTLDTVPEGFLEGFKAVRVLNLSSTNIRSLPSSLLQLCDLRALILRECKSLEDLPTLERLSNLQMLDLHASGIRELPRGMEKLSNLRQLDLSYTGKLKTIKARIISSLTSLQVLDMTCSAFDFCVKGEEEKGQTTFEELKDVGRLCILYIKLKGIPEDLSWIHRLSKFQIFIGPKVFFTTTSHYKRVVIHGLELTQESIKQLRSIASLESLTISHCQVEKCPSESTDPPPNRELGLEELHLCRVSDLESIGHLWLNFHNLKSIEVNNCSDMKYLFSCVDSNGTLCTLPSLEVIQVSFCNNLKELFNYGSGQNMASDPVVPKLRILKLWGLFKLSTLCRDKETWPRLEEVEVVVCPRLIRLPLTNQNAETIKEIRGESHWWNALKWDDDKTKSSLQCKFRHRHPMKYLLRYPFYDLQHFFGQSQRSIVNKTLGDEDFVSCFRRSSIGLKETDEKTEGDSVKDEEAEAAQGFPQIGTVKIKI